MRYIMLQIAMDFMFLIAGWIRKDLLFIGIGLVMIPLTATCWLIGTDSGQRLLSWLRVRYWLFRQWFGT
jgi:hypothetical protein